MNQNQRQSLGISNQDLAVALYSTCNIRKGPEYQTIVTLVDHLKLDLATDEGSCALLGIAYRMGWSFDTDLVFPADSYPELHWLSIGWEYDPELAF